MVYIEQIQQQRQGRPVDIAARRRVAADHAVVSGEDESSSDSSDDIFPEAIAAAGDGGDHYHSDDSENAEGGGGGDGGAMVASKMAGTAANDDLYDENLDAEDEAYVYRNMRGGVQEEIATTIVHRRQQKEQQDQQQQQQQSTSNNSRRTKLSVYKPRNSDAVLSCPCCFNIVCMDCQRHSRYHNQFRAIFVMGITVDWHKVLVYDPLQQALIPRPYNSNNNEDGEEDEEEPASIQRHHAVPAGEEEDSWAWLDKPIVTTMPKWRRPPPTKDGEYFAVECASCRTQVAALDMPDEVYHFSGCLESSAPTTY